MRKVFRPIALVALFTVGIWLVGVMLGLDIALLPSLLLSVAVTALLNAGAIRRYLATRSSELDHG